MALPDIPCAACGHLNPAANRFCGGCGIPIPLICSSCGAESPPGNRFCGACGTPLSSAAPAVMAAPAAAASPAPSLPAFPDEPAAPIPAAPAVRPPEERRLVTALFCDLVGFTPLSASLDPEEVRDLQAAYFGRMAEQIERYGGIVEKYAGDAVLALFGAPIAHEDDAERAVLCALGMQEAIEPVAASARARWQVEPAIRVGVNTGEVVSGIWEAGDRQDVAVTGDAINTAARIQGAAEPGEVLVGAETMRLTRRRIRYGERRELVLKGKMGTVPGHPALGVREAVGERWEEGERMTPLVGRERELLGLFDLWLRVQGGEGQLVTLVGEPGVGKSRLVAEVIEKLSSTAATRVLRARCLSYGQEISLWLLADLLRNLFGIRESDGQDEIRSKLLAVLPTTLAQAETEAQHEALDVLGEVLGLPAGGSLVAQAGPQIRRNALIRSLRLVLGALSQRAPTVVVLEDLHWMDAASEEVLKEVLTDVPGLRLLVLATARPGWAHPWSEWGWPERITLRPLRADDAAALAGAVLGGMTLSTELEQYIAERAGGNPFFVEELLRALEETGGIEEHEGQMVLVPAAARQLPSTLTEILLARLDRLEAQVKSVVQVGSVIGKSFAVRLLAEVMERDQAALEMPLTALQQAEIAFPRHSPDLEYVFKHVTMRDVAYNTLVQRRRKELHLQTARAIAELYPSDEYAEMIAYHYSKTDVPEAAEWLERAGDRAAAVYANEAAVDHYREAIRRLEAADGEQAARARLEEKLGGVLYTTGQYDQAIEHLGRAAEIYRQARDLEGAGRVIARTGMVHRYRGTPDEGLAQVRPMIELLAWSGPSQALALLHIALAHLFFLQGRYREQIAEAERAAEIARAIGDERLLGEAEERRAAALTSIGSPEESLPVFDRAIPLIEAGGDLEVLWRAFNNAAVAYWKMGRMEDNRRYGERALGVAERVGNPDQTAFILGNLGDVFTTLGDWDEAKDVLSRAMALQGDQRTASAPTPMQYLGQLALNEGRWADAERWLENGSAVAQRSGDRNSAEQIQTVLAELDVLRGNPKQAIQRLEKLAAAEDPDIFLFATLARAHLEAGDVEQAESVAADALQHARESNELFFLPDLLRVQGTILTSQERWDEADAAFEEGLAGARSLPFPYVEARILYQYGLMLTARGQAEEARERLEAALAIFQRLGARKDIEWAEYALAAIS